MRRSSLHIVIVLLLAILYIGERAVPCVEFCANDCHTEQASVAAHHDDDHGGSSPVSEAHHCGHCGCPCHIPALDQHAERSVPVAATAMQYDSHALMLPSAALHPPDHIPLL